MILDAAETVLTGRRPVPVTHPLGQHAIPMPQLAPSGAGDLSSEGPSYEVMYLLDTQDGEIPPLRARLGSWATRSWWSVVTGCGTSTSTSTTSAPRSRPVWRSAGRTGSGSPTSRSRSPPPATPPAAADAGAAGRTVIAVAAGPGLAALFAGAGALVVEGGPGRRPSTGELLDAIAGCGAQEIVILPNDPDSVRPPASPRARRRPTGRATRCGSRSSRPRPRCRGWRRSPCTSPGRKFDKDVIEMTATARHVKHGAVTIADKEAMTPAGRAARATCSG